MNLVPP
ncbi:rCG25104 [Rattus norvegicus]|nr:rCG25104 [Rattus norvegicus]